MLPVLAAPVLGTLLQLRLVTAILLDSYSNERRAPQCEG